VRIGVYYTGAQCICMSPIHVSSNRFVKGDERMHSWMKYESRKSELWLLRYMLGISKIETK